MPFARSRTLTAGRVQPWICTITIVSIGAASARANQAPGSGGRLRRQGSGNVSEPMAFGRGRPCSNQVWVRVATNQWVKAQGESDPVINIDP
jgi:hypothetical protein